MKLSPRWIQIGLPITMLIVAFISYTALYAGQILPNVQVGAIAVGGLTSSEAQQHINEATRDLLKDGITIIVEGKSESIPLESIEFQASLEALANEALAIGRQGPWHERLFTYVRALVTTRSVEGNITFQETALEQEVATVAKIFDTPGKDVRLLVQGTSVRALTDTSVGKVLDQNDIKKRISGALLRLDSTPLVFSRRDSIPVRNAATATTAVLEARRMIASSLILESETQAFSVSPVQLGQWITSGTGEQNALVPDVDREAVSTYVAQIAARVSVQAQTPLLRFENGKVVEFEPPRSGKVLEEEKTIDQIITALRNRRAKTTPSPALQLSMKVTKPVDGNIGGPSGIVELIGKATTTFAGSPNNRISNIKNGVKFLTGVIIAPGEEFSTVKSLGTIDNASGYLPELVIKEDRTVPEFGGGLCQVSTTLFRAVLNAGLPITARKNHSYRVSYYEKDALGRFIGPGLDATIYDPDPDFKFKNDTGASILVYGFVTGDTVTFELYGTRDGRIATVKGPTLLSTIPAGDPIYTETDTLPAGVTKQIETAHAGGTATATYLVTYPDGRTVTKEFKSSYRRWPAQFLVGRGTVLPTVTPSPTPFPSPAVVF